MTGLELVEFILEMETGQTSTIENDGEQLIVIKYRVGWGYWKEGQFNEYDNPPNDWEIPTDVVEYYQSVLSETEYDELMERYC